MLPQACGNIDTLKCVFRNPFSFHKALLYIIQMN